LQATLGVCASSTSADDFGGWVSSHFSRVSGFSIWQEINGLVAFQIDRDRSVAFGPFVTPNHPAVPQLPAREDEWRADVSFTMP
jgi:hypothetical protein